MENKDANTGQHNGFQAYTWAGLASLAGAVTGYLVYLLNPALAPIVSVVTIAAFIPLALRPLQHLGRFSTYLKALLKDSQTPMPDLGPTLSQTAEELRNELSVNSDEHHKLQQLSIAVTALRQRTAPGLEWVEALTLRQSDLVQQLAKVSELVRSQVSEMQDQFGRQRLALEDGQSVSQQLAMTHQSVNASIHQLAESVDETAASIEEMTYSIKEVARNIEDLSLAAEQTATSMNEMDSSISEVENNVQAASHLADEVSRDAARGADAVQSTLKGIEKIRSTVSIASSVIGSLGGRIGEIGNILGVIEEVAEQTNLLALNAAIIAAQAGEHGRGFAVVAEEIKDLSDKTGASTKEISSLIRSIQEESTKAVEAISTGERNVQTGVELSRQAEEALAKILLSSEKSTQRFKTIAAATGEQARGSKIVADAVERIARSVQQVAAATAEQARGSEQLMRSAETITDITHQVERASVEQGQGAERASALVESLSDASMGVEHMQDRILQACEQVEEQSRLAEDLPVNRLSQMLRDLVQSLGEQAKQLDALSAPPDNASDRF